jgi:DNA repair ATPase RecN
VKRVKGNEGSRVVTHFEALTSREARVQELAEMSGMSTAAAEEWWEHAGWGRKA